MVKNHCKSITGILTTISKWMKTTKGFFLDLLGRGSFSNETGTRQFCPTGDAQWPSRSDWKIRETLLPNPVFLSQTNPDEMTWRCIHFAVVHYCLFLLGLVILQLDMLVSVSKVQCASIGMLKPIKYFSCRIGVDKLVDMNEFKCSSPNSFLFTHVMPALLLVLAQA